MNKRKREKSVFEVDEHHLVLNGIQNAINDGLFSSPGIMINFDSHDDLAVPLRLVGAPISKKEIGLLIPHVEISSWILPCIAAKIYDELIWITEHNELFPPCTFSAAVATCIETGALQIVDLDETVPEEWREYWNQEYVNVKKQKLDRKRWKDYSSFQLTVCTRENLDHVLARLSNNSNLKDVSISMDLDFFSTTNPARRCIPFSDFPAFRRQLIDCFSQIPMLTCNAFFEDLQTFLNSEKSGKSVEHIELRFKVSLQKLDDEKEFRHFATMFDSLHDLVGQGLRLKQHREDLLQSLMQLALPEYKASWEEMNAIGEIFVQVLECILKNNFSYHILVARSELYTPKRQAESIRSLFFNLLDRKIS